MFSLVVLRNQAHNMLLFIKIIMILSHVLPFPNGKSELQHCLCSIPLYHAIVDAFMDNVNHVVLFFIKGAYK